MGPEALAHVLRPIKEVFAASGAHPDLLVGLAVSDDAAVYRLNDAQALILTTDFFPPVVDDAYTYGAIAAANSMSDVYAMGGEVLLAINVAGFPSGLPADLIADVFRGGAEKVAEAGGIIAGGHTISDDEPKYGLAVTGLVHPNRVITKGGAQVGDRLVLTKPIGSGVITTAGRAQAVDAAHMAECVRWMSILNREAARAMQTVGVHAATDITGFGLLGHAFEMAEASDVAFRFSVAAIPLMAGALSYAEAGQLPGGAHRNWNWLRPHVQVAPTVSEARLSLLHDPQTSGGLLIAVAPDRHADLVAELTRRGAPAHTVGEVVAGHGILLTA